MTPAYIYITLVIYNNYRNFIVIFKKMYALYFFCTLMKTTRKIKK